MNTGRDTSASTDVAFDGWKNSPGHYKNMMNSAYNKVGYAYYKCTDGATYFTGIYGS
jgi:uncharacterized protein YkwD